MKSVFVLLLSLLLFFGCHRPPRPAPPTASPPPTPAINPVPPAIPSASPTASKAAASTPPPVPTPTQVPVLPRKPVEMGKLFNGVTFTTKFATPASSALASLEREDDKSYEVQVTVTAKLPRASATLEDLAANDPKLPVVLNKMPKLIETAVVSPYFAKLYANKITAIREQLFELDQVLSRHNFYDCETILQLKDPDTARKALLIIGDMDVNVDGSDGDRNVQVDDSGRYFQPQTSYRWPKTTDRVNPLLLKAQNRMAELKTEFATPGLSAARNREIQQAIQSQTRNISDLKSGSFLVSATDPSIVVPSFLLRDATNPFSPSIGDYAAVIYNGIVYPAIVGDAGPSSKVGEASLRLCRAINAKSSAGARSVSNIKVAYLIFPGTAEKPGPPDLAKWREKTKQYLDEMGGAAPEIFTWEDIVPPWPTPTPTPTPEVTAGPSPDFSPTPSVSSETLPTPAPAEPAATASPQSVPTVVTPNGTL